METETKTPRDHLTALLRRKRQVLTTTGVIFLISASIAFLLPSAYRSTATVLIEQQEIPIDLVRSTISSYADQRIQVISQQVMTRANLMQIVEKFNLYPRERRIKTSEEILERIRKDIKVDLLKADVVDQRNGSKTTATIAFNLSYEGETPNAARKVANELATLFLSANLKSRQEKAAETSSFFADEADKLRKHLSETDAKLAAFKAKNVGRLPELMQLNLQLRDRADNDIQQLDREISGLEERKFYLEGQLAQVKPNTPLISAGGERILDADERLKALQAQYASLAGVYSSNHPDLVRMRREIDSLKKEAGARSDDDERSKQLTRLRTQLAAVREKYSDDHPDIIKLKRSISGLESSSTAPAAPKFATKPENPAYIALQAQLESVNNVIDSSRKKRIVLQSKIASYEQRLEQTPQVEREYLELVRDRDSSSARYREIREKQMQADIGHELEIDRKAERFSLIDPPQLPEKPSSPNRPAILLLGFVLALGGGIGSGAFLESMDESIRGTRALARLLSVPVLAVIPYFENDAEIRARRRVAAIAAIGTLVALLLAAGAVHTFLLPLDVAWYRAVEKWQAYSLLP